VYAWYFVGGIWTELDFALSLLKGIRSSSKLGLKNEGKRKKKKGETG
jgi:hypothetical protein